MKQGEYLSVGESLISVNDISQSRVKLAIQAPKSVKISRPTKG